MTALFALLWARERTGRGGRSEVSLAEALAPYADALRYGLLAPGTLLGGGSPLYGLYRAAGGWVALAALEPHFAEKLARGLGLADLTAESLAQAFLARPAREWEAWAAEQDIPLAAVHDPLCPPPQVSDGASVRGTLVANRPYGTVSVSDSAIGRFGEAPHECFAPTPIPLRGQGNFLMVSSSTTAAGTPETRSARSHRRRATLPLSSPWACTRPRLGRPCPISLHRQAPR